LPPTLVFIPHDKRGCRIVRGLRGQPPRFESSSRNSVCRLCHLATDAFTGEALNNKIAYWKEKLEGVESLQLPTDYSRPLVSGSRGTVASFTISKELSTALQELSQEQGCTLFMTLVAAFKLLLHRYSGQEDICVGTSVANRTQKEMEQLIGFFVNMLALRSQVNSDLSFTELLQQVRMTTLAAYEHQDVPFEKVVDAVVKDRDMSRNPSCRSCLYY
jgi:hypothetical protein